MFEHEGGRIRRGITALSIAGASLLLASCGSGEANPMPQAEATTVSIPPETTIPERGDKVTHMELVSMLDIGVTFLGELQQDGEFSLSLVDNKGEFDDEKLFSLKCNEGNLEFTERNQEAMDKLGFSQSESGKDYCKDGALTPDEFFGKIQADNEEDMMTCDSAPVPADLLPVVDDTVAYWQDEGIDVSDVAFLYFEDCGGLVRPGYHPELDRLVFPETKWEHFDTGNKDVRDFVILHEYGHAAQDKQLKDMVGGYSTPDQKRKIELQADCYAGRQLPEDELETAQAFVSEIGDETHGNGTQRKAAVKQGATDGDCSFETIENKVLKG